MTRVVCSNCNKILLSGDKEMAENSNSGECSECTYHLHNNTRTIATYNAWLKKKGS